MHTLCSSNQSAPNKVYLPILNGRKLNGRVVVTIQCIYVSDINTNNIFSNVKMMKRYVKYLFCCCAIDEKML